MLNEISKYYVLIFILTYSIHSHSQSLTEKTCYSVYNNLVKSIGNNNPRPPILELTKSKNNPASYNPKTSTIRIEEKLLEICYSFGKDSLNALSYILAHELGHHYQNHGYHARYASLDFTKTENVTEEKSNLRIDYESQADVYAGFYSHISGYDALSVASKFLDSIYKAYNLPRNIKNYPTLEQRKFIINKNKDDFNYLKKIFDYANLNLSIGNYDVSRQLFNYILNYGFTSREIYNNLGMSYIYEALDMGFEAKYLELLIPFKSDLNSRLSSDSETRSINYTEKLLLLIDKAKNEFSLALTLDSRYEPSIQNLFYSNLISKLIRKESSKNLNVNDIINTKSCCKNCVNGLLAFSENKKNKARSYFKKGSKNCDYCQINKDFKKKKYSAIEENRLTEFDMYDLKYNGIEMNCLDVSTNQSNEFYTKINRMRISSEKKEDMNIIKFKQRYKSVTSCISIHEYLAKSESYMNSLDIYVGSEIKDIYSIAGKRFRLISSGDKKYLTVINDNLTFLIENNKVEKWYYSQKLN